MVNIGSSKYRVIGLLAPKGASQVSNDNMAMIPVLTAKRNFGDESTSYNISIMVSDISELDRASDEAEGVFRTCGKYTQEKIRTLTYQRVIKWPSRT
jgi:putative ABC transport system permease protein